MEKIFLLATVFLLLQLTACETDRPAAGDSSYQEEIIRELSENEHVRGALNPFELIENPVYTPVKEITHLRDSDMVFLSRLGGHIQVFPQRHMLVEVVNDEVDGVVMAITYCPITRSAINWNRVMGTDTLLLTASGYLYKENLMPLDVNSGNIWSQMLLRRFQGDAREGEIFAFRDLKTFPLIETTWLTVREHFPEALVYVNEISLKSQASNPPGQELGIVGKDAVEVFSLDMFPGEISLHTSTVNPGGAIVVAGSEVLSYMLAFQTTYSMEPVEGKFPVIMMDETGTMWNIFGEGMMGLHDGETLDFPLYYTAADWAWRDLYDQVNPFDPGYTQ